MSVQITNFYTPQLQIATLASGLNTNTVDFKRHIFAPTLPVQKQKGTIFTVDRADNARRAGNDLRAPGNAPQQFTYDVDSNVSFSCEDHTLVDVRPVEYLANAEPIVRAGLTSGKLLTINLATNAEIAMIAAMALSTGITTTSPSTKFNAGGAAPLTYLRDTVIEPLRIASGRTPNGLLMDRAVGMVIFNSTQFLTESKGYKSDAQDYSSISERARQLSELLGLEPGGPGVHFYSNAMRNTAPSFATPVYAPIMSDNIWVGRVEPITEGDDAYNGALCTPTFYRPWEEMQSLGAVNNLTGVATSGFLQDGWYAMSKWDEDTSSLKTRLGRYYDTTLVNPKMGAWITDVLT
jgi:hypothetical protein